MKQPIPIFSGTVDEKGKLDMPRFERASMNRWLSTLKGQEVDITIRKHKKKRTNDQNAYYFGVVIPILADYFGYDDPETLHAELKLMFNPVESKIRPGEKVGGTTTKMSTIEFMAGDDSYVERICRWAAEEYGIYIPPPEKSE